MPRHQLLRMLRARAEPAADLVRITRNARREPLPAADAPLVSVVIATYNWSSVLRYAIASALWQTHSAIEVLVVGDACTDDSEAVVRSFADPRVSWHNLQQNSGSQSAPNMAGLERARGAYVAYLGHDDLWLPTHLALLVEGMTKHGAKIAGARCEFIAPSGSYRAVDKGSPTSAIAHDRLLGCETGWRDYREIADPPDLDFITRASAQAGGMLTVPALTVFKFPSAWRKNSYVEKPFQQQKQYAHRIAHERLFVYREAVQVLMCRLRRIRAPIELAAPPQPTPLGWQVTEWRKLRGLE